MKREEVAFGAPMCLISNTASYPTPISTQTGQAEGKYLLLVVGVEDMLMLLKFVSACVRGFTPECTYGVAESLKTLSKGRL